MWKPEHRHAADRQGLGLPPSDGAKDKVGIADLKEGIHAAKEAFG
jgi:hypothetical protein